MRRRRRVAPQASGICAWGPDLQTFEVQTFVDLTFFTQAEAQVRSLGAALTMALNISFAHEKYMTFRCLKVTRTREMVALISRDVAFRRTFCLLYVFQL